MDFSVVIIFNPFFFKKPIVVGELVFVENSMAKALKGLIILYFLGIKNDLLF